MDDSQIIALYWSRNEGAIAETASKYGSFCHTIAYNILSSHEDAQECVNDTYLAVWDLIPPKRPMYFSAFLGKITRHISIDRWRCRSAYKRGGGETALALEELAECLPDSCDLQKQTEAKELCTLIRCFLRALPDCSRIIFLKRYWALESIPEIAAQMHFSVPKVKSNLHRTRMKLRLYLEKEGYYV